jgi:predicted AlkP superfamily pyrophosphatase or phosphodiesterase
MLQLQKSGRLIPYILIFVILTACGSKIQHTGSKMQQPKLVVGIVIDQMRYDYLYRYWDKYGNGGFKRLLREGYSCANTNINYVPTYTGPGHAAIYTGTTPSVNGIVGNEWFDRKSRKPVYCVSDTAYMTVGNTDAKEGRMSPNNLLTTTVTDELRLSSNFKSKVIGISLKDRGAILPAGHSANAAYWYDAKSGNWISSSYYLNQIPGWVNDFNNARQPEKFLSQDWNTLLPIGQYSESSGDTSAFEEPFKGEAQAVFPHHLQKMNLGMLRETPFGNSFTKNFAEAAIKSENLGRNGACDFLAVSFSSTDYIGHRFGPNSVEVEDTYLRLDKDIEEFLDFLDGYIGKENVLVFLTADHGAANNPGFMYKMKLSSSVGNFNSSYITDTLRTFLVNRFHNSHLVEDYENQQIYLNKDTLSARKLTQNEVTTAIIEEVKKYPGIGGVVACNSFTANTCTEGQLALLQRGYYESRSGDIAITLKPGWLENKIKGTTHGSGYSYDTHIPLIFYGWRIRNGETDTPVSITDIAPTIASILHVQFPSGCTGKPIPAISGH